MRQEIDRPSQEQEQESMLGMEAMPPPTGLVFSRREQHILLTMQHMISKSVKLKKDLSERITIPFGEIDDKGRVVDKYWDIDRRFLWHLNNMIFNRYTEYCQGDYHMEAAAKDLKDTAYSEQQEGTLTPRALSKMWEVE